MNHLFDDVDDGNRGKVESSKRYRQRLHLAAKIIIYQFGSPQVLALQEVENINVLNDIGNLIFTSGGPKYRSILLEGNDISGIDIGYLIRADLRIREIKQLFKMTDSVLTIHLYFLAHLCLSKYVEINV